MQFQIMHIHVSLKVDLEDPIKYVSWPVKDQFHIQSMSIVSATTSLLVWVSIVTPQNCKWWTGKPDNSNLVQRTLISATFITILKLRVLILSQLHHGFSKHYHTHLQLYSLSWTIPCSNMFPDIEEIICDPIPVHRQSAATPVSLFPNSYCSAI